MYYDLCNPANQFSVNPYGAGYGGSVAQARLRMDQQTQQTQQAQIMQAQAHLWQAQAGQSTPPRYGGPRAPWDLGF